MGQNKICPDGDERKEESGWIFSQKQEVKSVGRQVFSSSDSNLIAVKVVVKYLIVLCILRIICNCRFFSQ